MATATAIIALVISLGSFAFSIYQYRILHRVRISEKATSLIRVAQELRRKSEDLKHKIDSTDHAPDCADFLATINAFVEKSVPSLALSNERSLQELFEIEQRLLSLELEVDLLHKQIAELGRFNEEVREFEARKVEHHAL